MQSPRLTRNYVTAQGELAVCVQASNTNRKTNNVLAFAFVSGVGAVSTPPKKIPGTRLG